ncbi:AAA family ATPase [Flavobacterium taihuense]|uniref:AAA family ATPase n=1 Tax=Flavobacterium taihuense TaxID=2857508 RepID=A0ABS6Y1C8_9FLAO|nr:AAA family ATPase [Flavobacterium taihuense]MBW4362730.1 AAA family ATPase [Flavobacterium taihuense]
MGKIKNSGFKLIGIKPHKACHSSFVKVLEPSKLYQFYNEYKFYNINGDVIKNNDVSICTYTKETTVPDDLYNIDNLDINISAVVGKNGSGKSTVIELLLYCVYVLGTTLKNDNGEKILKPYHIQLLKNIEFNDKKIKDFTSKKMDFGDLKNLFLKSEKKEDGSNQIFEKKLHDFLASESEIKDLQKKKESWEIEIKNAEMEHDFIIGNLKCSIFFELDNLMWELNTSSHHCINIPNKDVDLNKENKQKVRNNKISYLLDQNNSELLSRLFYTIMLNYSHHSLNSDHLGYWITTLFHKNDGYKTPAVINPMRDEGNFDINKENSLAKSRLLINLLIQAFHLKNNKEKIKLTDKQFIHKIRFTLDDSKEIDDYVSLGSKSSSIQSENFIISGGIDHVNLIQELLPLYFEGFDEVLVQDKNLPYSIEVINYLIGKVRRILKNYPEYHSSKMHDNIIGYFRDVLPVLKEDGSHVTFKINRGMFFLKKLLNKESVERWKVDNKYVDFDLDELLEWMEINNVDDLHLISQRVPPSIFNIDFILDGEINKMSYVQEEVNQLPTLQSLSSGEQHKIHTINSIVYHLNNIFSVHNSSEKVKRIKYEYVNIIFDEIELYFHPDLQREFINDLLNNIKRLKYITQDKEQSIKGLNFLFSTHSPFILSDIPSQNILKIKYDSLRQHSVQILDNNQTFGANIHDLLANSFFFEGKTFTGEKSNEFINDLIDQINILKQLGELIPKEESDLLLMKATLIGEPFFKQKLCEMIIEQTQVTEDEKIDMIIDQKKKEIQELENLKKK